MDGHTNRNVHIHDPTFYLFIFSSDSLGAESLRNATKPICDLFYVYNNYPYKLKHKL